MKTRLLLVATITLLALVSRSWGQAESSLAVGSEAAEAEPSNYLKIIRGRDDEPIAMQTSIVTFRFRDPQKNRAVIVDLIGAVHVADKAYFTALNKRFQKYDALLYELVAPENNNVPSDGKSQHPVGQLQQGMKSMLELSFQLEEIDYSKKNFVHADMSPEEFSRVMSERGESPLQMLLRMMGSALAMQSSRGKNTDSQLLFALFADDRALRLKRVMATQFQDLDGTMAAIEGADGSTLIGQRNKKALSVLRRELGKGKRRIGLFYGAGHMPDMEQRLAEEFGLHPEKKSIEWLTAWDMKGNK